MTKVRAKRRGRSKIAPTLTPLEACDVLRREADTYLARAAACKRRAREFELEAKPRSKPRKRPAKFRNRPRTGSEQPREPIVCRISKEAREGARKEAERLSSKFGRKIGMRTMLRIALEERFGNPIADYSTVAPELTAPEPIEVVRAAPDPTCARCGETGPLHPHEGCATFV